MPTAALSAAPSTATRAARSTSLAPCDSQHDAPEDACRFCAAPLTHSFVDLGMSPLCQTHIAPGALNDMEPFYPLHVRVCGECFLVQLGEFVAPAEIFRDYAYFSSWSDSWVAHAKRYAEAMVARWRLGAGHQVWEVASNDGYLLQHFLPLGVPVLGIEPAANVAEAARERGVPTVVEFFGVDTARQLVAEHGHADLLVGNNVLAHVPDLNDFVAGMAVAIAPAGVITMEFPHLERLIAGNQFDTIYHEHFSYFSFTTVTRIFAAHGLTVFDVEELPTHGGSLRVYAGAADGPHVPVAAVSALQERERAAGFTRLDTYTGFGQQVDRTKHELLAFLIEARRAGKSVAGYGAPGKGNTLLNYCGIRRDFLDYTVDRNPHKQGTYTPGTRIPIHAPEHLRETRPDYVLILPWNLKDEIMETAGFVREWGGRFVVPIPTVQVYA